jgi:hypothetical protein
MLALLCNVVGAHGGPVNLVGLQGTDCFVGQRPAASAWRLEAACRQEANPYEAFRDTEPGGAAMHVPCKPAEHS